MKIIDKWTKLIGYERAKIVTNLFFDKKIDIDFPNIVPGDLTHIKKCVIAELESVGNILMELDKNVLSHEEIIKMIDLLAGDLISKTLPDAFIKNISDTLLAEEHLDKEIDEEIEYIKRVLKYIHSREEDIE